MTNKNCEERNELHEKLALATPVPDADSSLVFRIESWTCVLGTRPSLIPPNWSSVPRSMPLVLLVGVGLFG